MFGFWGFAQCPNTPQQLGLRFQDCISRLNRANSPVANLLEGHSNRFTEETVGWTTFGRGARRFGVRGQAKRDPAMARSPWGSGPPKRRRRCALPAHSKGPVSPILRNPL